MKTSAYAIEFHGGHYDAIRLPCEIVPPSSCLEMPGPELILSDAVADRAERYEHSGTMVALVAESPVVTFHFRYTGSRIDAPRPKPPVPWSEPIRAVLRGLWPRPPRPVKAPGDVIRLPGSRKETILHTRN
jgi:hypothetical protein